MTPRNRIEHGRSRLIVACIAALAVPLLVPAKALPETVDSVVLTVDGMTVLRSEILGHIKGRELTQETWEDACRELALRRLVEKVAEDEKISVSDAEVDTRLDERLKELQLTRDQVRDQLPDFTKQMRQKLVRDRVIRKHLEGKVVVSSAEVKEYYEDHKEEFRLEEKRHLLMISVLFDKSAADPDTARNDARQKIEAIAQQLNEGKDFTSVARGNTNDPYAEKGGDLGWTRRNSLVGALDKAAFSLEVGQNSEVIESPTGFHIIRVEQTQPEYLQPFGDVEETIRKKLSNDLYVKRVNEYLDGLLENAVIERYDDDDKPWLKPNP